FDAVQAASAHTNDGHLILVANGYQLDTALKQAAAKTLATQGWRGMTTLELPEFEGYASAINRAMEIVPSDSIVAILSTSHLLAGSRKSSPIINKPLTAPAAPPSSLSPSPSSHLGHNPGGQTSRDTNTRTDSSSGSNRTDNEDEEIIADPDVFVAYERL
ncbi:unnamed protein product, partial [Sphacelaria rigidula]